MSMPLAFQNRVPGLTYLSYGALTKILISTDLPSGGEIVGDDLADRQAPVVDRRADVERAEIVGLEHELPARLARG